MTNEDKANKIIKTLKYKPYSTKIHYCGKLDDKTHLFKIERVIPYTYRMGVIRIYINDFENRSITSIVKEIKHINRIQIPRKE